MRCNSCLHTMFVCWDMLGHANLLTIISCNQIIVCVEVVDGAGATVHLEVTPSSHACYLRMHHAYICQLLDFSLFAMRHSYVNSTLRLCRNVQEKITPLPKEAYCSKNPTLAC